MTRQRWMIVIALAATALATTPLVLAAREAPATPDPELAPHSTARSSPVSTRTTTPKLGALIAAGMPITDALDAVMRLEDADASPGPILEPRAGMRKVMPMRTDGVTQRLMVKFRDDMRVRTDGGGSVLSLADRDIMVIADLLQRSGTTLAKAYPASEERLEALRQRAASFSGKAQPDLGGTFYLDGDPGAVHAVGQAFYSLPEVEWVFWKNLEPVAASGGSRIGHEAAPMQDRGGGGVSRGGANDGACWLGFLGGGCFQAIDGNVSGSGADECAAQGGVYILNGSDCTGAVDFNGNVTGVCFLDNACVPVEAPGKDAFTPADCVKGGGQFFGGIACGAGNGTDNGSPYGTGATGGAATIGACCIVGFDLLCDLTAGCFDSSQNYCENNTLAFDTGGAFVDPFGATFCEGDAEGTCLGDGCGDPNFLGCYIDQTTDGVGDPCASPFCSEEDCCDAVCELVPECCTDNGDDAGNIPMGWNVICAAAANCAVDDCALANPCAGFSFCAMQPCNLPSNSPGCASPTGCCACVLAQAALGDPLAAPCATGPWTQECVDYITNPNGPCAANCIPGGGAAGPGASTMVNFGVGCPGDPTGVNCLSPDGVTAVANLQAYMFSQTLDINTDGAVNALDGNQALLTAAMGGCALTTGTCFNHDGTGFDLFPPAGPAGGLPAGYSGLYGWGLFYEHLGIGTNGAFGMGVNVAVIDKSAYVQSYTTTVGGQTFTWGTTHEELGHVQVEGPTTTGHPAVRLMFDWGADTGAAWHGTAVLAAIGASWNPGVDGINNTGDEVDENLTNINNAGIMGLAPQASLFFFPLISVANDQTVYREQAAWFNCLETLGVGDIICAPYTPGFPIPNINFQPDTATLIALAGNLGIITVVAAGDDSLDLDAFAAVGEDGDDPHVITVGAVLPGTPFRRLPESNLSLANNPDRVATCNWGAAVVTASGFNPPLGGILPNTLGAQIHAYANAAGTPARAWEESTTAYMNDFGGTSAATALVAGTLAGVQGWARQVYGLPLAAATFRDSSDGESANLISTLVEEGPNNNHDDTIWSNGAAPGQEPDGCPGDCCPWSQACFPDLDVSDDFPTSFAGVTRLAPDLLVRNPNTSFDDAPEILSVDVIRGQLETGNVNSIRLSDNQYLVISSEYTKRGIDGPGFPIPGGAVWYPIAGFYTDIIVNGVIELDNPFGNRLAITVEHEAPSQNMLVRFEMFDFTFGRWVQVLPTEILTGTGDANPDPDGDITVPDPDEGPTVANASRFVGPSNEFHLRLSSITGGQGNQHSPSPSGNGGNHFMRYDFVHVVTTAGGGTRPTLP